MCYLITFAVPEGQASGVPSGRLPRVAPHQNQSLQDLAGPGFALFSISEEGCSCRLFSPPADGDATFAERRARTLRQKYARSGWSKEKIDRALASSAEALEHNQHRSEEGLRSDVAAYLAELAERAGPVKVIVHSFRGSFAEEPVAAARRVELSATGLRQRPQSVVEDVLYTIR
jgi:hypothetical protein